MLASRAFLSVLALSALASTAATAPLTIPRGTRIIAQLDHDLRSDDAAPGDRFELTVVSPVRVGRELAIPPGSALEGRVTVVRSGARSGVIGVRFTRLGTPDGRVYEIDGVLAPTHDGQAIDVPSSKKTAVVLIGNDADAPGKRASTVVGNSDEDPARVADRWSQSGLSPQQAFISRDSEVSVELRSALTVEAAFAVAP
jgi:hypothetical protein